MELQTERLLLRHWHENDAKSLYKYARNPRIGGTAGWPPHTDVDNSRELIKTVLAGKETYAMVLKDTGEAVGSIALLTERGWRQRGRDRLLDRRTVLGPGFNV